MKVTEPELVRWGYKVGESLPMPCFVMLRGPLGAGKSVLARAIARGAGVEGTVPSPTFNLSFRYPAGRGGHVIHMDLYRIQDPTELWEMGWQELGSGDEIVLVEWPERAGELLPGDRWEIELSIPEPGVDVRKVEVNQIGRPPHLPGFPLAVSGGGAA